MHDLHSEQFVAADIAQVAEFFAQPENLARLTPDWLGFRILTPAPIAMRESALIDYEIRLGPLPMRWRTLITSYDPPHLFVDEQLSGPYSFWHHTHTFEAVAGGTMIRDHVRYLLPFGALGSLVQRLVVRRQLEAIFRHRAQAIAAVFSTT